MAEANSIAAAPLIGSKPARLEGVDFLRGLVMVIMALDHVRDYFSNQLFIDPVDLKNTTPGLFFTRWISHFCAPVFIFLAGTGAYLAGTRGRGKAALSWFLFSRGLWCVLLELTVIKLSWAFHWRLAEHGGGVFWAIGWSMVAMAGLVFLPLSAIAVFGVSLVTLHNAWDGLTASQVRLPAWLWTILHAPGNFTIVEGVTFGTAYCLVPWIGVMALGYFFGALLSLQPQARRRELLSLGLALTVAFLVLRYFNVYGDASRWSVQPDRDDPEQISLIFTCCSFLNCTKYPPSLLYLLMTLGPAILVLPLLEKVTGPVATFFVTFGRVPLFFYLLHIPLIHGSAVLLDCLRFGWSPLAIDGPWVLMFFNTDIAPPTLLAQQVAYTVWLGVTTSYGFSLPVVYLIWGIITMLLYPPCRWFAGVKQRHKAAWLSYL